MKILSLILIGMLLISVPSVVSAASPISLSASATVSGGSGLGQQVLLKCKGYKVTNPDTMNPWDTAICPTKTIGGTALDFGTLSKTLRDVNGNPLTPNSNAGCFYAEDFFVVYLYPDAWGGTGYQLFQSAASIPLALQNSMLFTPVYAAADIYDNNLDGDVTDPGEIAQGALTATEETLNPQVTPATPSLASAPTNAGLILKAYRPRIVRAQYSIPPYKADNTPWATGWVAVPLTTAAGPYSGSVTITLNPI